MAKSTARRKSSSNTTGSASFHESRDEDSSGRPHRSTPSSTVTNPEFSGFDMDDNGVNDDTTPTKPPQDDGDRVQQSSDAGEQLSVDYEDGAQDVTLDEAGDDASETQAQDNNRDHQASDVGENEDEVFDRGMPGSESNEAGEDPDAGLPGFNDVGYVTPCSQTAVS